MFPFRRIADIGDVYVPTQYRELTPESASWKLFTGNQLGQFDRIFTHLRRGGVVVLSGDWEQVIGVMQYIERKKGELTQSSDESGRERNKYGRNKDRRHHRKDGGRGKSENPIHERERALSRLMCWADPAGTLQVNPPPDLPYLLEWVGENQGANEGHPFLIPIVKIQKIQKTLSESYPIHALGVSLVASDNVLPPHSQETIELFQQGLQSVKPHLSHKVKVLDMGCGCGCLTLLALQEIGGLGAEIYGSDLLPEAVGTARLNLLRFADGHSDPPQTHLMPAGDLFQPVAGCRFDLIIFNAPWVVSRARNRAEVAIHDEKQQTLRRFFDDLPSYLNPTGRVLIGYADASGAKAITRLEAMIDAAGLTVLNRFKERVATHRTKRKWENITVYELVNEDSNT
ncbi:class I SAM-dependent methyltransferase [Candidatus Poribacteria bacterium]|nr:class I SAM-dependent methyltransferase [Candidatus Poribacteria bacterium]